MANTHTGDTAWAFRDEDFTLEDYPDNYPHNFFDLENENLFPRSRFPMLCRETAAANNAFSAIEPGLWPFSMFSDLTSELEVSPIVCTTSERWPQREMAQFF